MQPNPVTTPAASAPTRRRPVRAIGLSGLAVGLVGAGACWYLAGQSVDDAVAGLAPAPVGCDTTLEFDRTGEYTFYVETRGEVDAIDGNCDREPGEYEFTGDGLPRISLTLVDPDGDEVDLDRVESPTYDADGARGTGIRVADIDDTGTYLLTVEANADDVMVRVGQGREPAGSASTLRTIAVVLGALGVLSGVAGLVLGRGGPASSAAPSGPAAPMWQPLPGQAAPTAPPSASSPDSPPYAWPPGTPPAPPTAPPSAGWPAGPGNRPLPPPGR